MQIRLGFFGAAQNVTGSRYFVEANGVRLLVDCGLHQEREFRSRDWDPFPVSPETLDAVLLTHAHLDHSGFLPRLVRGGFNVASTQNSFGWTLLLLGRASEAAEHFGRHLAAIPKTDPLYPYYLSNLANARLLLGKTDDALARYRESVAFPGFRQAVIENLADFRRRGLANPGFDRVEAFLREAK